MLLVVTSWLMINMVQPEDGGSQIYHLCVRPHQKDAKVTSIVCEQAVKRWKQQPNVWVQAVIIDNKSHNRKHLEQSHRCLQSHYQGQKDVKLH